MEQALSGTTIHSVSGIEDAASLIMGDLKKSAKVAAGKSEVVLRFPAQSFVQNISFVNDSLQGTVFFAISFDGSAWISLAEASLTSSQRLVNLKVGKAQGRYVKLAFESAKGGNLRGVQVLGSNTDANFIVMQNEGGQGALLNFANGVGGGRLIYLNNNVPGSAKDAAQDNVLRFSAAGSGYCAAVYDLGQERTLQEFGSIHSRQVTGLSVYAFGTLPEKESWRGRPVFDPSAMDNMEPVAVAQDVDARGYLVVRPDKEAKARFVALRWELEPGVDQFEVYGVSISGAASVFFQNNVLTATTFRNADGVIVTKLRQAATPEELLAGPVVASLKEEQDAAQAAAARMFAHHEARMGFTGGMFYSSVYNGGAGRPIVSGRGKNEGEVTEGDEDSDPPAIHIIWCEEASP
jgi:hypothetical protein